MTDKIKKDKSRRNKSQFDKKKKRERKQALDCNITMLSNFLEQLWRTFEMYGSADRGRISINQNNKYYILLDLFVLL